MNRFATLLKTVVEGTSLTLEEATEAFQILCNGGATPAQIAAFLIALKSKGEVASEIAGGVKVLRHKAVQFKAPEGTIDTCGTGGDGLNTLNVSTAVALVAAACGVPVAKHGNKAVSSSSGSADVLMALGIRIDAPQKLMEECLAETNFAFLLAPSYHPALRHAAPVRQELGVRTIFNVLGPLSNPANVKRQVVGVYDAALQEVFAEALKAVGVTHAWIVHSRDGMDEISLSDKTDVVALENGTITRKVISPEEFGFALTPLDAIKGGSASYNATALLDLANGKKSAYRDCVVLNTAAALVVAGKAKEIQDGIELAAKAIDEGKVAKVIERAVIITTKVEA